MALRVSRNRFRALVFPAPGSLGSLNRCFQVELDAEESFRAHAAKTVSEVFAGN